MAQSKRYVFSAEITVESDLEDFGELRGSVITMLSNTAQILSKYGDTEIKKIDVVEIRQEGFSLEKSPIEKDKISDKLRNLKMPDSSIPKIHRRGESSSFSD